MNAHVPDAEKSWYGLHIVIYPIYRFVSLFLFKIELFSFFRAKKSIKSVDTWFFVYGRYQRKLLSLWVLTVSPRRRPMVGWRVSMFNSCVGVDVETTERRKTRGHYYAVVKENKENRESVREKERKKKRKKVLPTNSRYKLIQFSLLLREMESQVDCVAVVVFDLSILFLLKEQSIVALSLCKTPFLRCFYFSSHNWTFHCLSFYTTFSLLNIEHVSWDVNFIFGKLWFFSSCIRAFMAWIFLRSFFFFHKKTHILKDETRIPSTLLSEFLFWFKIAETCVLDDVRHSLLRHFGRSL